jgi:single-strand DNA-binding protein
VAIAVAASPPPVANGDRQEQPAVSGTGNEGDQTMNDTTLTITGNLVDNPELRFTSTGNAVGRFRIASTPRYYDKASGEWKDGETLFLTVNVWRQLAEHVAESMVRGTRAIVTGRLRQRSYEKDGEKRTVYELEADEVGVSLRNATAKVTRGAGSGAQRQADTDPQAGGEPPL